MRTWEDSAACAPDADGAWPEELFQVTQRGNPHPGVIASLCDGCAVRGPCLADGWWDEWSIRGGLTPRMRGALAVLVAQSTEAVAVC